MTNDLTRIRRQRIGILFSLLLSVAALFVAAGLMFYCEPITAAAALLLAGLMTVFPILLSKRKGKYESQRSTALAKMTTLLNEFFSGFEVISSFGIQKYVQKMFTASSKETYQAESKTDESDAVSNGLAQLLSGLAQSSVLCLACWMVYRGRMTVGALTVFISMNTTFCAQLSMIMQVLPLYKGAKPLVDHVLEYTKKADLDENEAETQSFQNGIQLRNVSYHYNENVQILDNISLDILKGKKYALTGESGSGKTTLIRLLSGEYDNYTGKISIDGKELHTIPYPALRKAISVIQQDVFLFDDSIRNNICLYEEFTDEQLERAVNLSGVRKFIGSIPEGLDYSVGEGGTKLSGGQRQRIAIARALIRNTPFLIIDEGTSALDYQNAVEIEEELLHMPDLTLLVISHHFHNEKEYSEVWITSCA